MKRRRTLSILSYCTERRCCLIISGNGPERRYRRPGPKHRIFARKLMRFSDLRDAEVRWGARHWQLTGPKDSCNSKLVPQ